ncbi:hypothetical protein M0208_04720 [Sphingomonas sp. SUN019]|uniref:hypothetical protein n=1 Tax=Sphingomonas sp. SUN019 TaxID=2937788 RepID=UPI0021649664|nr:hypothetical protein [Sphingomonas sp. SUN019]UVO49855.1 hypothetical protein M0208_04720 [Sphingomonas sp. SUN019]
MTSPSHFVISLDLEQAWGMEAEKALGKQRASILGARDAIPRILALAERHGICCTWATVGLLFFDDRDELLDSLPAIRPAYDDLALSPYPRIGGIGRNEREDPLHFGRSLIRSIRDCPGQEIAGHTFSHYYCLEDGGDPAAFEADLAAAHRAAALLDIELRSIVFPRNQLRQTYLPLCRDSGYRSYRGNQRSALHRSRQRRQETRWSRVLRAADNYLPLSPRPDVNRPRQADGMVDVAASRFLRPASTPPLNRLQLGRIRREMTHAATHGGLFHLWWHPQNFGHGADANLRVLGAIFDHYRRLADDHGMVSATMDRVARSAGAAVLRPAIYPGSAFSVERAVTGTEIGVERVKGIEPSS